MTVPDFDPSRQRLQRDLATADFEGGVSSGLWRLAKFDWPHLIVAVTAGDGHELGMQLSVDDYPAQAPAGQPWDLQAEGPLPVVCWPTGGTAPQIFRLDWSVPNGNAPYMACDRVGLRTHPDWATTYPDRSWNPSRTVSFYLRELHHVLRCATLPEPNRQEAP